MTARLLPGAWMSAILLVGFVVGVSPAGAADLGELTISPNHTTQKWDGSQTFDGNPPCATSDSCDTVPLHLQGIKEPYLQSHYAVLRVTISWSDPSQTYTLELDNNHGHYIRSSSAATDAVPGNPLVQQVAVHLEPGRRFARHLQILVVPGQSAGGYTGQVKLVDEPSQFLFPDAGFDRQDLSLVSEGRTLGAGEPSIALGPSGTVHVVAPAASPAALGTNQHHEGDPDKGVIYFRSPDGGQTWTAGNIGAAEGGGDSDVVADAAGGVYVEDLALAPSTIFDYKSTDEGQTFNDLLPFTADADREWEAVYLPDSQQGTGSAIVYTVYHGLANQEPFICVSMDGGATTSCTPGVTDPQVQVDASGNTIQGNVVVEQDGDADFLFGTSTLAENLDPNNPAPGTGPLHNLYLAHYDLATGTVTDHAVYLGPLGNWITGLFPVLAIDRADNLYASWPESPSDTARHASGPWALKISHSTDGGQSWSDPDVMNPPRLHNNLLNWVTAGNSGKLDVIWAGTTAGSNEYDARARWNMFFAQTGDGLSDHPDFTYHQITPHPIRYGNVCVLGLFCPSDDSRSLLDFAQVELDQGCRANVVYGDNAHYIPRLLHKNQIFRGDGTATDYALQGNVGTRLCHGGTGGAGGSGSYDFP